MTCAKIAQVERIPPTSKTNDGGRRYEFFIALIFIVGAVVALKVLEKKLPATDEGGETVTCVCGKCGKKAKAKDNKKNKKERQKIKNGGKQNEEVFLNNPFIADDVFVYVDSV